MLGTRVQRYFLMGQIALVSATSYMASDAVDESIRDRISGDFSMPEVHSLLMSPIAHLPTISDISVIARGNLFDPEKRGAGSGILGDLGLIESSPSNTSQSAVVAIGRWQDQKNLPILKPETLKLRLVGTLMGSATQSGAVLELIGKNSQKFYHVNETVIPGQILLAHVQRSSVILKVGNSYGVLKARYTQEDDSGAALPLGTGPDASHGIHKLDETHWLIESRALHSAVKNLNQLMMQARAVPNITNGKTDGFRIIEIQPGSLYQEVGLMPGDVIQTINGMSMGDPQNFMKALSTLGTASQVSINLVRNGAAQTFSYQVQ